MVAFDITCDCLRSKLDRQGEESEAKCSQTRKQHSLQALTTFNNISKSNHSDTYRDHENHRKIQRKIRRRNAECTSETKPQSIAFIMARTQAFNLEIHCAIAPRCFARLVFHSLATLARAIIMMSRFDCCLVGGLKQLDMQDFRCHTLWLV